MPSRGNKFLAGYWPFVSRFITGYLLICCAVLFLLLVVDLAYPRIELYARIKGALQEILSAPPAPVRP